jgi:FkbM family methyltransferase
VDVVRREEVKRLAARLPPFTSPIVRDSAVRAVRRLRRRRRLLYERAGSARFSRPGLCDLDRKLEAHLRERNGFFVEAGANDGYQQSNTYYLERFKGWSGILIEPIPELYRQCVRERPKSTVVNCALVAEGGPTEVTMRYRHLTSVVSPKLQVAGEGGADPSWDREYEARVPARTLSSVLKECGADAIDLLSLDVEGYEVEVLRGLDLDRHAPRFIVVEPNAADEEISALLGERYELVESLPPNDVLYRRRDAPCRPAMRTGPRL